MTEAVRQGIAGTGVHNWIFSDSAGGALTRRQQPEEVGSPLALAIRGSGLISASGGKAGFETFDKLAEALVSTRNPVDKAYIESKMRQSRLGLLLVVLRQMPKRRWQSTL